MSSRLGAAALCRPLKNSRDSTSAGARCSARADHAAISSSRAFVLRVFLNPFQNFAVAFGQFLFQCFGINAGEFQKPLVERAGIMVFAVFAGDGRAALVQHSRQDHIAAQPHARTARRKLRQIRCVQ